MGYHRAGFDIVGIDTKNQPRYPFEFHVADALEYPLDGFDAIHASPPCPAHSVTRFSHAVEHPTILEPLRERLIASGLPYVIENVPGAPLHDPITLCGAAFECTAEDVDGTQLVLKRHRIFEINWPCHAPPACACRAARLSGLRCAGVYGSGAVHPSRSRRRGGYVPATHIRRKLLGIEWMTVRELSDAIPPAYTYWIGLQLGTNLHEVYDHDEDDLTIGDTMSADNPTRSEIIAAREIAVLKQLAEGGMPLRDIATKLDETPNHVYSALWRLKFRNHVEKVRVGTRVPVWQLTQLGADTISVPRPEPVVSPNRAAG